MIIVLTCAESDALPFLSGLPKGEIERATLVATRSLAGVLEVMHPGRSIWVMAGVSSVRGLRKLVAGADSDTVIVTGPDYGTLLYRKGFVRARLLAPWLLPDGKRANLVRIRAGGEVSGKSSRCRVAGLLLRVYPREALVLSWLALMGVMSIPIAVITLGRLLPFLLVTEARARTLGRRSGKGQPVGKD